MKTRLSKLGLVFALLPVAGFAADVTITIDATKPGTPVPAQFLGLFAASNQDQTTGFDPYSTSDTHRSHLVNLVQQMGVKHWRVEGSPVAAQQDETFQFIYDTGSRGKSAMWGLWLWATETGEANAGQNEATVTHIVNNAFDYGLLDAFAAGNEPDQSANQQKDPYITGYCTSSGGKGDDGDGVKLEWQGIQASLTALAAQQPGSPAVDFMGCDTSAIASLWDPNGTENQVTCGQPAMPWMLRFAIDEAPNLKAATQHLYVGDANYTSRQVGPNKVIYGGVQDWASGTPYGIDDEVTDPQDVDSNFSPALHVLYKCTSGLTSTVHPGADSGHWQKLENFWATQTTYHRGDVVRDPTDSDHLYQCVVDSQYSTNPPSGTTNHVWVKADRKNYAFPGPHQLAMQDLDPARQSDWETAYTVQLQGASNWPKPDGTHKLPYWMSEFSPFAGPYSGVLPDGTLWSDGSQIPNGANLVNARTCRSNCFGSALIGLEMLHWWARKGASGVSPETHFQNINSPIFMEPNGIEGGDYTAEPWAYAFPAFYIGAPLGEASELWPSNNGIQVSSPTYNVSAYATYDATSGHVYITVINKTFALDGLHGNHPVTVAINMASTVGNFTPSAVQYMTLTCANGTTGDSTVSGAVLGGHSMSTGASSFPKSWQPGGQWTSTYTLPVSVGSFTAMIIDLEP